MRMPDRTRLAPCPWPMRAGFLMRGNYKAGAAVRSVVETFRGNGSGARTVSMCWAACRLLCASGVWMASMMLTLAYCLSGERSS